MVLLQVPDEKHSAEGAQRRHWEHLVNRMVSGGMVACMAVQLAMAVLVLVELGGVADDTYVDDSGEATVKVGLQSTIDESIEAMSLVLVLSLVLPLQLARAMLAETMALRTARLRAAVSIQAAALCVNLLIRYRVPDLTMFGGNLVLLVMQLWGVVNTYRCFTFMSEVGRGYNALYARAPTPPGRSIGVTAASPPSVQAHARKLDTFLEVTTARAQVSATVRSGHFHAARVFGGLVLYCTMNTFLSMGFAGSGLTGELFATGSSINLAERRTVTGRNLTDWTHEPGLVGADRQTKVVIVVWDGMRYDHFNGPRAHPDVTALLEEFSDDLTHMPMTCSLPSMSVPNWLTLLTGAPPEVTGAMGNIKIPETWYDSIFKRVQQQRRAGALTGSPWFAEIVESVVEDHGPFDMRGTPDSLRGTVSTTYNTTADNIGMTARLSDEKRGEIAVDAIVSNKFDLFLAHFSDIDGQGHSFGVSPEYNQQSQHGSWTHQADSYNTAIADKVRILRNMMAVVDDDTTVVITADHGHVDAGGHGGVEPEMIRVPLALYRRNSGVVNSPAAVWPSVSAAASRTGRIPADSADVSNVEFASMVTALLGLPAPAHSTGSGRLLPVAVNMLRPLTVAEDVEGNPAKDARDHHLQLLAADLALQQRDFTSQMATELSQVQSGDWVSSITQTQMQEINSWMDAADLTLAYHAEHVELRDSDSRWTVGLNIVSSLIFASLLLWVVNNNEDAPYSPRLLLPSGWNPHACGRFSSNSWLTSPAQKRWNLLRAAVRPLWRESWRTRSYDSCVAANRWAAAFALGLVGGYFLVVLLIFMLVNWARGYGWSATLVHNIGQPIYIYLVLTLLVGWSAQVMLRWFTLRMRHRLAEKLSRLSGGKKPNQAVTEQNEMVMVVLTSYYVATWIVLVLAVLLVLQSPHSLIFPSLATNRWVTTWSWVLRFRVVTVQCMSLPLVIGCWLDLKLFPTAEDYQLSSRPYRLDGLYRLATLKAERSLRMAIWWSKRVSKHARVVAAAGLHVTVDADPASTPTGTLAQGEVVQVLQTRDWPLDNTGTVVQRQRYHVVKGDIKGWVSEFNDTGIIRGLERMEVGMAQKTSSPIPDDITQGSWRAWVDTTFRFVRKNQEEAIAEPLTPAAAVLDPIASNGSWAVDDEVHESHLVTMGDILSQHDIQELSGGLLDGAVSSFLLPTTEGTTDDMTALRRAIKTARRPVYSAGNVVESGLGLRRRKLFEALEGSDGPSESPTAEEAVPPPAQVDNPARCETGAP